MLEGIHAFLNLRKVAYVVLYENPTVRIIVFAIQTKLLCVLIMGVNALSACVSARSSVVRFNDYAT